MIILALDLATKTGICHGQVGGKPSLALINFKTDSTDAPRELFGRAMMRLGNIIEMIKPDLVVIEAPINPAWGRSNYDSIRLTTGLFAVVSALTYSHQVAMRDVQVNEWRKYALGSGKIKGPDAKRAMVKLVAKLGWGEHRHDACEAAGIWLWACAQIDPKNVVRTEPLFVGGQ